MQSNSSHKRKLTHKFTQLKVSGDFPPYPGVFSFELMGATLETWHKSTELRPLATKPRHFPHYQMAVLTSVRTSKFLTSHDGSPSREKHKFRYICRPSAAGDGRSIPAFFFFVFLWWVSNVTLPDRSLPMDYFRPLLSADNWALKHSKTGQEDSIASLTLLQKPLKSHRVFLCPINFHPFSPTHQKRWKNTCKWVTCKENKVGKNSW